MWNLGFFFSIPALQLRWEQDAGFPWLFLGQCLRARTTCTAPAGKLSQVITLKISTCCQPPPSFISSAELSEGLWQAFTMNGRASSFLQSCTGGFTLFLRWTKVFRIPPATTNEASQVTPTCWYFELISVAPVLVCSHHSHSRKLEIEAEGGKYFGVSRNGALEASRCWCREVWQNVLLCLTG